MTDSKPISRRTVLRGVGAAMALPLLDVMGPSIPSSLTTSTALGAETAAIAAAAHPLRMACLFFPNGAIMPDWTPATEGPDYELPPTLAPLADVKDDITVLSGLAHDKARANGDGPGDHARCSAAFLTGVQPYKTNGADIRAGVSIDQLVARELHGATRLPSLELGTDPGLIAGNCDSGYSCAYVTNISWASPNTPMPKEVNPRIVFERLFGADDPAQVRSAAQRDAYRQSILDVVRDDAQRLSGKVGGADQRKLDEYFTAVREIELRIAHAQEQQETEWTPDLASLLDKPEGIPSDFGEHLRLMADLNALAFQADITRVSTFMFSRAGSNRSYAGLGVPEGHHHLSHHRNNQDWIEQIRKIDRFHVEQFAYFIRKLKSIPEGDGTLLDHSMILYGSGIADGNRHSHHDLPIILAGKAGGALTPGQHIRYDRDTPVANLFVSMMDRMNVKVDSFGDSTGRLKGLGG